MTRAQILDYVWDYDFAGERSVVEQFVSSLRKKVDPTGSSITTIRGHERPAGTSRCEPQRLASRWRSLSFSSSAVSPRPLCALGGALLPAEPAETSVDGVHRRGGKTGLLG